MRVFISILQVAIARLRHQRAVNVHVTVDVKHFQMCQEKNGTAPSLKRISLPLLCLSLWSQGGY